MFLFKKNLFFLIDGLISVRRSQTTKAYFSTSIEQQNGTFETSGDRYDLKAIDYISWDPKTPVLIRNDTSKQGNYPPILVQTFLRQIVEKHANKTAIKYKEGTLVKSLTYCVSICQLFEGVPS